MELYMIYFGTLTLCFIMVPMTCGEPDKQLFETEHYVLEKKESFCQACCCICILLSRFHIDFDKELSHGADEVDCAATNSCDETEREIPNQRETSYAYEVEYYFMLAETTVKFFGEEIIFEVFVEKLNDEFGIQPEDVFSLTMAYIGVLQGRQIHSFTFVLQPGNYNVSQTLFELWNWTDCYYVTTCPGHIIVFTTNIWLFGQHFRNRTIEWSGIKTVICFEIDIEHGLIEGTELLKDKNQVAEFLHDRFLISQRDIYDLSITSATRETPETILVEFALPPILANDISELLMNLKLFIDEPCADGCKLPNGGETKEGCSSCESIGLFGASVYPYPGSFKSRTDVWTGNETRFKRTVVKGERRCTDHQEPCTNRDGVSECVGIGLCDKFFYKTIEVFIGIHGSLRGIDINGLNQTNQIIASTLVGFLGFCESAIYTEFVELGRTTTRLRMQVMPFLGREERMKELENKILFQKKLEIASLFTIYVVNNSYTQTYQDPRKPVPRYMTSYDCFECRENEVWCILPSMSLCMTKLECIEIHVQVLKAFSYDTDLVRVSILMSSETGKVNITNDLQVEMKRQIAEQINCSLDILSDVEMVPSDSDLYEIGFDIYNQDNLNILENHVLTLYRITDTGKLHIYTREAKLTSVLESFLFQQLISGYPKSNNERTSTSFWNAIIIGSLLPLLVLISTFCVVGGRRFHNRCVNQKSAIRRERLNISEKTPKRRHMTSTVFSRA